MDPYQTLDESNLKRIEGDFRLYRSIAGTLVGVIITLASGIIFSILSQTLNIEREWLSLFGFALISIFISLVLAVLTLYFIFQGYYRKANRYFPNQDKGNPDSSFNHADSLVFWSLILFLIGIFLLFVIYFNEFFL